MKKITSVPTHHQHLLFQTWVSATSQPGLLEFSLTFAF